MRTNDYLFSQLIPYIGNKRKLLHLIQHAVQFTQNGVEGQRGNRTFVDLFTGSTVVARWAKQRGFRVLANDWEPYAHTIASGTVALNVVPAFDHLGGSERVFARLNDLPGVRDYIATNLCPRDDEHPEPDTERMFFTQGNGQRIDAIREQIEQWQNAGQIDEAEFAYLIAPLIYAVSYASNTSGVFKGFHRGWGGATKTALYRILRPLALVPPVLFDNGQSNHATRRDAHDLAADLRDWAGGPVDVVYLDPPYNQHPYGSNYHVLNTVALWDKPAVEPWRGATNKSRSKSAIRTDWRTARRSPYNFAPQALPALEKLLDVIPARNILLSYSTDGNMLLEQLISVLGQRGQLTVFCQRYKRYRVSTPRYSPKSHNLEFVAVLQPGPGMPASEATRIVESIHALEAAEPAVS